LPDHLGVGQQRVDFLEALDGLFQSLPDGILH